VSGSALTISSCPGNLNFLLGRSLKIFIDLVFFNYQVASVGEIFLMCYKSFGLPFNVNRSFTKSSSVKFSAKFLRMITVIFGSVGGVI